MRRNFLSGNESWMVSLKHLLALSLTLALTTDQVAGASPPAATSRLSDDDQLTQLIQHHSNDREHGLDRHRRSILTPLGKRITSSLVAELGKRPRELYSFGIGNTVKPVKNVRGRFPAFVSFKAKNFLRMQ